MILGTAQLGMEYGIHNRTGKPNRETAFRMLDYAWEHGVPALDTAGAYGDSEALIGSYQQHSGHKFEICTKTVSRTADELIQEMDQSLKRLNCDRIWVYYLHYFDFCKSEVLLRELERAKETGKIAQIGISVYEPKELEYILQNLSHTVDVVQLPFNLLDHARWQEADVLARAKEQKIQLFARSVFLQGLFFQEPDSEPAKRLLAVPAIQSLQKIAAELSMSMQQTALSFVLGCPWIDEILLGCETREQLAGNLSLIKEAGEQRIPEPILCWLQELSAKADSLVIDPRKWNQRLSEKTDLADHGIRPKERT